MLLAAQAQVTWSSSSRFSPKTPKVEELSSSLQPLLEMVRKNSSSSPVSAWQNSLHWLQGILLQATLSWCGGFGGVGWFGSNLLRVHLL